MLSENEIYSYEDLTQKIEKTRMKIHQNNAKVKSVEKEYKTILDRADKAQEFIRLFKTHQYCKYYKSLDKNYEPPIDETIFLKLRNELKIETIEEAKKIISAARQVRLSVNQVKNETRELQNQLNNLDIIKEDSLVKSEMYLHNIKFGNNRIDYSKSTDTHWYINIPYTNSYMYLDKDLTTFNHKYGYHTAFLIDDKEYQIYNNKGETMTTNGLSVEQYYLSMKQENDQKYKQDNIIK